MKLMNAKSITKVRQFLVRACCKEPYNASIQIVCQICNTDSLNFSICICGSGMTHTLVTKPANHKDSQQFANDQRPMTHGQRTKELRTEMIKGQNNQEPITDGQGPDQHKNAKYSMRSQSLAHYIE